MDFDIALFLAQDGLISGAVYALVGVALVLIFTLTRVIAVFLGEFVAYGALTFIALQADVVPKIIWLTLVSGIVAGAMNLYRRRSHLGSLQVLRVLAIYVFYPALLALGTIWLAPTALPLPVDVVLTFLIVVPLASYLYTIVYQPVANSSVLVLLIVSMGVHLVLLGLGLVFFGADGLRAPPLATGAASIGAIRLTAQQIIILGTAVLVMFVLRMFFGKTFQGTALRATAVNRLGAQLVGIPPALAGQSAFIIAGFIGALCGILIGPVTTIYYDTGFTIALKGFVAAVIGALASFPITAMAAVGVGVLESFASFTASQYKEVITFGLIVPALLLRSLFTAEEDHD
ncbi:branched-chain amino acid ABC transporter permease [Ochrobactrum sp. BTU2]|uniref:branched-chain amino acid ABC transporter permease n=1 Tax=Ochrobactrum sp. BTU2 TaxID=2856166 RepID=UPI00211A0928|nr:branched-chain amino acid ABC transporter permease [Ochrobactrum sp. BTU2]MCQ9146168.1 branched-chain amino acid ABC transporter permease [Ochrobactrum sp. BTU2]